MAIGNTMNYYDSTKQENGKSSAKELMVFAIIIALSLIPMLLFMEFAYIIVIVVDMGGIYIIGIFSCINWIF